MKEKKVPNHFQMRRGKLVRPAFDRVRTFDLQLMLPPYNYVILDVLNSLEIDLLMVLDEDEEGALASLFDSDIIDLSRITTKRASIKQWLSAGCQVIRWDVREEFSEGEREMGALAKYVNNSSHVMFQSGVCHQMPGPMAFVGEIIINSECFSKGANEVVTNRLKFVLAHELTHVFDMLRLLIPAHKNWPKFWRNIMGEGQHCDYLFNYLQHQARFVDNYGSEDELAVVSKYWPSKAEEWFTALRGKRIVSARSGASLTADI